MRTLLKFIAALLVALSVPALFAATLAVLL